MDCMPITRKGLVPKIATVLAAILLSLALCAFCPIGNAEAIVSNTDLTFDANGGVFDNGASVYSYGTISSSGGVDKAKAALSEMQGKVSREGWSFVGWYSARTGGSALTTKNNVMTSSTRTAYAQWRADSFELAYDLNGGQIGEGVSLVFSGVMTSSAFGDAPKPNEEPMRTGYVFAGWGKSASTNSTLCDENTVLSPANGSERLQLYAQWTPAFYAVTYDATGGSFENGESTLSVDSVPVGSALSDAGYPSKPPVRPGFTFNGWWTKASGGAGVSKDTTPSFASNQANSVTYYAQWIGQSTTITFDANGGSVAGESTQQRTAKCGDAIGSLPNPEREHYVFDGWFDEKVGGNEVTAASECSKPEPTYYAHWKPETYTVSFYLPDYGLIEEQKVEYGKCASAPDTTAYDYSEEKKVISGWCQYYDSSESFSLDTPIEKDMNLEAEFRPFRYTVQFKANGGEGSMAPVTKALDDSSSLPSCKFKSDGYYFDGWSLYSDPSEDDYVSYYYELDDAVSKDGDTINLYAIWWSNDKDDPDYDDEDWDDDEYTWKDAFSDLTIYAPKYGDTYIKGGVDDSYDGEWDTSSYGYLAKGASVKVSVGGKTYKGKVGKKGTFKIKAKALASAKIGAKVKVVFAMNGKKRTVTKKVKNNNPKISVPRIYHSDKTKTFTVKNVHKGDVVKVKVGKKTFEKKVKKATSKLNWKVKIAKPKEGSKITVTVVNKHKQKLSSKKVKVYYASKVKKGMTKAQVKLVPGYEYPDGYSSGGKYTYYTYNWDSGYEVVHFKNNKVYQIDLSTW